MDRFTEIEEGVLLGPQPTEDDLRQAKQKGMKTVIDFRMPNETSNSNADSAARHGLEYVSIPVNKASLSQAQIEELDRAMQDKEGPFLIHCASGARAALLLSLRKAKQHNWSASQTFEEARRMGFDLSSSPEFAAFIIKATTR